MITPLYHWLEVTSETGAWSTRVGAARSGLCDVERAGELPRVCRARLERVQVQRDPTRLAATARLRSRLGPAGPDDFHEALLPHPYPPGRQPVPSRKLWDRSR